MTGSGFFLPNVLGTAKQVGGSFGAGFAALACVALVAVVVLQVLTRLRAGWRWSWSSARLAATAE